VPLTGNGAQHLGAQYFAGRTGCRPIKGIELNEHENRGRRAKNINWTLNISPNFGRYEMHEKRIPEKGLECDMYIS
jgi:hypothetical protein